MLFGRWFACLCVLLGLCTLLVACETKSDCAAFCDMKKSCAEPVGSFNDLYGPCVNACVRVDEDTLSDEQKAALACLDESGCEAFNACVDAISD